MNSKLANEPCEGCGTFRHERVVHECDRCWTQNTPRQERQAHRRHAAWKASRRTASLNRWLR